MSAAAAEAPRRPRRVAIVEDDSDIALSLAHNIQKGGDLHARTFASGEEFLEAMAEFAPDCILLDLGLPGIDGTAVCQEIRNNVTHGSVPILILTARVAEADKLLSFELGVDDYVTKPYSVREVVARVRALIRRSEGRTGDRTAAVYQIEDVRVDCGQYRVFVGLQELRFTRKEFELLKCLIEARGHVVTRETLLQGVWGYDFPGVTRTVDVHVTRLRRKLGEHLIETVIGAGYRLSGDAAAALRMAQS